MVAYDILGCQGSSWDSKLAIPAPRRSLVLKQLVILIAGSFDFKQVCAVSLQLGMATIASNSPGERSSRDGIKVLQ